VSGLDPGALQFVREWAAIRRGEILTNWERARRDEPLLAPESLYEQAKAHPLLAA
jgi:hypothetical protein